MKAIIFDLDNTLFKTDHCQVYLRSKAGRSVIPQLIKDGIVKVNPINDRIINFVNKLIKNKNCDVYIFSDSPKNYCLSILEYHHVNINSDNVYGSQHKPTAEDSYILDSYKDVIIIGDSPKDIYFAHINSAISVLIGNFNKSEIDYYELWTKPTAIITKKLQLESYIELFLSDSIQFSKPEISTNYITADPKTADISNLNLDRIGYSFEYWPNPNDWGDDSRKKSVWFDVQRSIKVSKYLTETEIKKYEAVSFYNQDRTIGKGRSFRKLAYSYYLKFEEWLLSKKIRGRIYLVATPSSVPFECNKSSPIQVLIDLWSTYAFHNKDKLDCEIIPSTIVERFWPTKPAHMSNGRREIEPHLETLGIYSGTKKFEDPDAVIIIDDVVTSGTQMKAVATLLSEAEMYPADTPVYGYALVKTTRPNSTLEELLHEFSNAEKGGA